MQIETKKSKIPFKLPPIQLDKNNEMEEEEEEKIQIPNAQLLNRLIDPLTISPQEFVVPIRFSAQQNQKDSDGFFIPHSKKDLAQNTQNNYQNSFQNQNYQLQLKDIKRLDHIGNGSSGIVERALHLPTQTIMALKDIQIINDPNFTKQINLELQTLVSCDHQNIIKCYGAFQEGNKVTIVMEYMNMGTLQDVVKKSGRIPQIMLGQIAYQILQGLVYLHKAKKIIHRDIKPSNILINSEGIVKISDFGVSGQLLNSRDQRSSWVGTITYMSPERFRGEPYSSDTDIWSLGLSLLECAWGQFPYPYPYSNDNRALGFWELMEYVNQKPIPAAPSDYDENMYDFIKRCLQKEKQQRMSAADLLNHPVIKPYHGISLTYFQNWLSCVL